jgi:magnesium transporter
MGYSGLMKPTRAHFEEPVLPLARQDFTPLQQEQTVGEALAAIRREGLGERIVYFYVVDAQRQLVGVVPTRRLLTSALEKRLDQIMIRRVVSLPDTATVLEACELFVMHRFFAFPVVDAQQRLVGVVDVGLFEDEVFDIAEKEQADRIFEVLGFRVSEVADASPARVFRYRFPWLLTTIGAGTLCAMLASSFAATLAQSLVLAFFLTLVLWLGEGVSMQSMTVTIQLLHFRQPSWRWFGRALKKELGTAALLGVGCGGLVAAIVYLWQGAGLVAVAIGSSILVSLCAAGILGLSMPALLHTLKLDPKIASGPVTLALADLCTLLTYFTSAWLIL